MTDLIRREDAIKALYKYGFVSKDVIEKEINAIPSADRPSEVIYGNEHNCIMTIFGKCSYAETGCGDCAVVEKVRKALSADRPQGEWKPKNHHTDYCSNCGFEETQWRTADYNYCPSCGARMKGVDDEHTV
jgi:hypothetical protein